MSTITIPRETFDAMIEALERIVVWNTNPLDSGLDAGRGITSVQLAQDSEALTAAKAVIAEECTCQAKEMPFGRCCKAVQPQAQGVEPVGAESKFVSSREWSRCTIEHHEMVQLSPSDWNGYETRLLYTTPQEPAAAGWMPIETAPEEGTEAIVSWIEDGVQQYLLECFEDGVWICHSHSYEHYCMVASAGMTGPKEMPPYTHWMPLPAAPGGAA